jgi:NAD(P)-dependent dehydrogenase (short-subunit alcohol dehydrogenase family)
MRRLEGETVIVTGGTGGISESIALRAAEEGPQYGSGVAVAAAEDELKRGVVSMAQPPAARGAAGG